MKTMPTLEQSQRNAVKYLTNNPRHRLRVEWWTQKIVDEHDQVVMTIPYTVFSVLNKRGLIELDQTVKSEKTGLETKYYRLRTTPDI